MVPDLDIYRSANLLVKQHGEDAPVHAAMRADVLLEKGDLDGYAVWKRVLRAVGELRGTVPEAGMRVYYGNSCGPGEGSSRIIPRSCHVCGRLARFPIASTMPRSG